jgi:mono/diheme cytochrome c family protein
VEARISGIGVLVGLGLAAACVGAPADDRLFRDQVAAVLETHCVGCHGERSPKGGLSLATRSAVLKGGKSGPAVVAGKPEESVIVERITGDPPEMPQKGEPLSPQEVAGIRTWIQHGATWPAGTVLKDRRFDGQRWWSLEPLVRPPVSSVRQPGWARTPIDAFILAELEKRGLKPNDEADRPTLIRRLSFDLTGLPPEPAEIQAFVSDASPDAYERLVARLLSSPHYGERWGRHWLDVVHYGDTHGYDKDKRRDHAWPYRDYVIASFNADVPFGRFIQEQVAGDVLWPREAKGIIATGFIAAGPWDYVGHVELREGTIDKLKTRLLDRDDMVSSTMSTFVSMTVHCARCHDHKFDPITQTDYYRLQAVFAGVDRGDRTYQTRELAPRRAALEQRRAGAVERQLQALPKGELAYTVLPHAARPIALLRRGDVEQPGEELGPGTLACVPGLPATFALEPGADEGARRAALARWLASAANGLTWRSIANRLWHYHFGRGIVETPNDFGRNGALPTHPELLDWLAVELRDGGQSLKALHRMIVSSAVYRQSSRGSESFQAIDADNRYLWRQNRRRLDAEAVRDGVLAIAGTLDRKMGGPGFEAFAFKDDHSPVYDHSDPDKIDNAQVRRRSVYRFIVRSVPNPFMEALDCADPNLNTPVRTQTLTALQALALWNDLFMVRQSQAFARRLEHLRGARSAQIVEAFERAFGRQPSASERDAFTAYADKHGLAHACRLLFNANEFVFVD